MISTSLILLVIYMNITAMGFKFCQVKRHGISVRSLKVDEAVEIVPPNLFDSIMKGHVSGVKEYIEAGFECNVADLFGEPAINQAARLGHLPILKMLFEAGANPDYESFDGGDTALMQGAAKGHIDIVKYLIEVAEVDINRCNHIGDTALSVACFWGQVPVVKYLLAHGADTETLNNNDKLPGEEFDDLYENSR